MRAKGKGKARKPDFSVGKGATGEVYVSRMIVKIIRHHCEEEKDDRNISAMYAPKKRKERKCDRSSGWE